MEIEDDIDIEEVEYFFKDSGRAINQEIQDSEEINEECVDSKGIKEVYEGMTKEIKKETEDAMEYEDSKELDVECKFDIAKLEEKEEIYVWNSFERSEDDGQTQENVKTRKKHFCKFCKKLRSDFGSHLKLMHSTEYEVIEYMTEIDTRKKRSLYNKIAGEGSKLGLSLNPLLSPIRLREDKRSLHGETRCISCQFLVSNLGYERHLKNCNLEKLEKERKGKTLILADSMRDPSATDALKEEFGDTMIKEESNQEYEDPTNEIKEETEESKELDIECAVDIAETEDNQEIYQWNSFDPTEDEGIQENVRSRKKHFCKFCKKLRSDFGSHLKLMHSMEDEVIEYLTETNKNKKRTLFNKIAGEGSKLGLSLYPHLLPIRLREDKRSLYGESRCINCQFLVSNKGYDNHLKKCNPQKLDKGRETKTLMLAESMRDPYCTDALKEEFKDSNNEIKEESVDFLEYEDSKELDIECADDIAEAEKNQEICQWSSFEGAVEEGQTQKKVKNRKKHFCKFCRKLRSDFGTHLKLMHSMEDEVKEYLMETNRNKKRTLFNKIAGEGSKLGLSMNLLFSPIKLREDKRSMHGESRCVNCKFLVSNMGYERHLKKCNPLKLGEGKEERKRNLAESMSDAPFASATLKKILFSMNKDEVTALIKKDKVLCELTERFLTKHQANAKANKLCARLLRILGRIFLEVQNLLNQDNIETIISGENLFRPDYYHYFERALKKMAKINSDGFYEKPSIINQYGLLVKATAEFCVSYFTKTSDHLRAKNAKKWLTVYGGLFKYVSVGARKQLRQLQKSQIKNQKLEIKNQKLAPTMEEPQPTLGVQEKENPINMDQSESDNEFFEDKEKAIMSLTVRKTKISRARIPEDMLRLIRSHFKSFILKQLYPPIDAVKEGQAKLLNLMPNAEVFQRTPEKFRVVINNEINKIKNRQNKEK